MKKIIFASALCAMALTACQEEDFGVTSKDIYKSDYGHKFVNQFGAINPNEDWDFTRAVPSYNTVASNDGWYYVESGTLEYFQNEMKEYVDNRSKVHAFTLVTEEATTFEIVPLYQGGANYTWSADMVVDGQVYADWTWEKGDGSLQGQYGGSTTEWENLTIDGQNKGDAAKYKALRSRPTTIELGAGSHTIYFRINSNQLQNVMVEDNTDFGWHYEKVPVGIHTSIENPAWIGVLENCPIPENVLAVNPKYTTKIITCEGQSATTNDPDFNEAAFLLVGYVPEVITEDVERSSNVTKRYMMEDYGTIDWDFNDVVVDVITTTTAWYTINHTTGETTIKDGTTPTTTVTAKIAHLGGTYPVMVTVGESKFPLISNPNDQEQTMAELTDYDNATHNVAEGGSNSGWNPTAPAITVEGYDVATHNVKLTVYKDFDLDANIDNEKVYVSEFPEPGSVPFIVVTGPHAEWTAEGVSVTSTSWWGK